MRTKTVHMTDKNGKSIIDVRTLIDSESGFNWQGNDGRSWLIEYWQKSDGSIYADLYINSRMVGSTSSRKFSGGRGSRDYQKAIIDLTGAVMRIPLADGTSTKSASKRILNIERRPLNH